MGLTPCPECGNQCAADAKACPKCGKPNPAAAVAEKKEPAGNEGLKGCLSLLAVLAVGAVILAFLSTQGDQPLTPGRSLGASSDVGLSLSGASESSLSIRMGCVYTITGENLTVVDEPKTYTEKMQFLSHVVTVLVPGDQVTAMAQAGALGVGMTEVHVTRHQNGSVDWYGFVPTDLLLQKSQLQ